jgi:hypothetical protein
MVLHYYLPLLMTDTQAMARAGYQSEGSFEVNPPFVESMYTAVAEHCAELLSAADAAGQALRFIIVVGATVRVQEGEAWARLRSSRYSQGGMVVDAKEHQYCDGAQHTKTKTVPAGGAEAGANKARVPLVSVCATGVFFWASRAAAASWLVDEDLMGSLRVAFRASSAEPQQTATQAATGGQPQPTGAGGYANKRKADRLRQKKQRNRQKARKNRTRLR